MMLYILIFGFFFCSKASDQEIACIKSFVTYYDCSQEGRYTHEYHPFLLQETRKSFEQLETFFLKEGFICPSRTVIMGYQEEGVPSFLPAPDKVFLQDEYMQQSEKGKTIPAHNVFGFLTGFLLKDAQWMQDQWFSNKSHVVIHHRAEHIPLFNDYAYLFQKNAFGQDLPALFKSRNNVEKALKQQDGTTIIQELSHFWQRAYKGELKNFSHQVLATQDILFSIDYAQHIVQSTIPVTKIYTGPDITYPIEVLSYQEQNATESAQQFVERFGTTLVPINDKKTAYIFCSFVDGVGKSTLLGNVINWKKHGIAINHYSRVDNSSSQRSTLYQLDESVFILDLPAQLSHFVSKPDGYVFVPLDVAGQEASVSTLQALVHDRAQDFIEQFEQASGVIHDPVTLYEYYISVAQLFAEKDWIPFVYQEQTYLFHKDDQRQLRVAVPLEGVQSRGLKVAHPTHMLFTKGLSLPMHTDAFMNDCAQKLKAVGVETLVFVDFLSMYPRSSRENVRVNFILQELKKLYGDRFDSEKSLYKTLTNGNLELLYDLQHNYASYTFALLAETVIRTALYELFNQHATGDVRTLSSKEVTSFLQEEAAQVIQRHKELLVEVCQKKIALERHALSYLVDDPTFQTVVNFSWKPLVSFSQVMERVWQVYAYDQLMSSVWVEHVQGHKKIYATFSKESKDKEMMAKVIPLVRASWYISLLNLLYARPNTEGVLVCDDLPYPVAPCTLNMQGKHMIALHHYPLAQVGVLPAKEVIQPFLNLDLSVAYTPHAWGSAHDTFFMQPYDGIETVGGIFGLGYSWSSGSRVCPVVEQLFMYQNSQKIITSSAVLEQLQRTVIKKSPSTKKQSPRIIDVHSPYRTAIAFVVRALATLEMIAKDQQSMIITRRGHYEDFRATVLLIERYLLPDILNTIVEGPLFVDYDALEPVIPWDTIRTVYS